MLSKKRITAFLEQYKEQKNVYKEYANTVKFILETLLKNNGFNYQVVFAREKDFEKLQDNFEIKGKYPQQLESLSIIKDLAGCRVIFYLESDIQRFIAHIYKEFSVIEPIPHYSADDYNAQHFVVYLNKDRLSLTEYSKFEGLKCEIQLTTVLYHAWSEMAHDIIYKPQKELPQFEQSTFESLKKQFSDVMHNHIRQASYSFEFIYKQFEKLKQGKKVFDIEFLDGIFETSSNNGLYENLSLLRQYVQEFGDKTPREIDIIKVLENALNKAKENEPLPIKRTLGTIESKNYVYIADVCLDILSELRYFHTEKIFELLIGLSIDSDHAVMNKAIEVLSRLATYNLPVLQKIGYSPQLFILDQIKKWDHVKMIEHFKAITEIASQLLKPSFEGHSMTDYKTFTLRHGPLVVNEDLINIRKDTITILGKTFTLTSALMLKINVLQALNEATQPPYRGEYKDDMKQMIISNTNEIVDFYINILPDSENEIISVIEEQSHQFSQKFGADNLPKVRRLQTMIESNPEYEMFRVFVGYDRGYLEGTDWEKAESMRKSKIKEYIADISEKNFKEWQKQLLSVIKNYTSSKHSEYLYFSNIFLFGLGEQKPSIALRLIQQNEKEFEPFLLRLIWGMWESKFSIIVRELMSKWIEEDKHLQVCASLFTYDVKEVDIQILEKIFEKAKKYKDVTTLNNIMDSIVTNYSKCSEPKPLFIKSIKELTKNKNAGWVNNILHRPGSIWESLNEKDFEVIIENLLLVPRIDYHAEQILMPIANKYPKKVIHFFYRRVENKEKKQDDFSYDAIPFDLHKINEPLQKQAKVVIADIIKWYSQKIGRFEWEASHLIHAIFPAFNKELEKELIKLIESKKEKNIKIVLSILRAYQGDPFLHNVCKNIVRHSPYVGKCKSSLFIILSQTGVVSGEYGFVNAYKQKLEEVQSWKKERSKAIRSFIKEYEDYLNKRILEEQKRADEDLELRRREFGE